MTKRLKKDIVSSDFGGELFLYDGEDDAVHILNRSAGIILGAYLKGKTAGEIARALRKVYSVEPKRNLRGEIQRFIERLERERLVVS
jgi:hypothetical protein